MKLRGKNAIVTGAANGIGRCLAERLVAEGANVGAFDIDRRGLEDLQQTIPLWIAGCDVSNSADVYNAVYYFHDKYGTIDILVNNAAIVVNSPLFKFERGGLAAHDMFLWDNVIKTNLSSVFYMTLNVVEKMIAERTRGVVVNVSSVASSGNVGQGAYSAAKAGVEAATVTWAKELSAFGIRVAAIAPGFTNTEMTKKQLSGKVYSNWVKATPSRRFAEPDEIVDGILFIIKNDFFNGRILRLDGGLRI